MAVSNAFEFDESLEDDGEVSERAFSPEIPDQSFRARSFYGSQASAGQKSAPSTRRRSSIQSEPSSSHSTLSTGWSNSSSSRSAPSVDRSLSGRSTTTSRVPQSTQSTPTAGQSVYSSNKSTPRTPSAGNPNMQYQFEDGQVQTPSRAIGTLNPSNFNINSEEGEVSEAGSMNDNNGNEQEGIQESLENMKGLLQKLCDKVDKNEKCLKDLQNHQQR